MPVLYSRLVSFSSRDKSCLKEINAWAVIRDNTVFDNVMHQCSQQSVALSWTWHGGHKCIYACTTAKMG